MGYLKVSVNDYFSDALQKKLREAGPRVAHTMAVMVQKDTEPFVPARTKSLVDRTQVVENRIVYPGPYARFLYGGKVMIDPMTGSTWARKGAKKIVTEKDLDIKNKRSKDGKNAPHPDATDHWFNTSVDRNLDKWTRAAAEAIERELKLK